MFLLFSNVPEPIEFDNGQLCVDEPGLYCLVECMDNPFGALVVPNVNQIANRQTKTVSVDVVGSSIGI
jgi:hypothetical protein